MKEKRRIYIFSLEEKVVFRNNLITRFMKYIDYDNDQFLVMKEVVGVEDVVYHKKLHQLSNLSLNGKSKKERRIF